MNYKNNPVIYPGNKIGGNFICGHFVLIRENNTIGNNVRIGSYTEIAHHVLIEDNVQIHSKCFISEFCRLKRGCWLGPGVYLINDKYPQTGGHYRKGCVIEEGAILGAGVRVMPGIIVGREAIIGTGMTVTKDIPPEQVWIRGRYYTMRKELEGYK